MRNRFIPGVDSARLDEKILLSDATVSALPPIFVNPPPQDLAPPPAPPQFPVLFPEALPTFVGPPSWAAPQTPVDLGPPPPWMPQPDFVGPLLVPPPGDFVGPPTGDLVPPPFDLPPTPPVDPTAPAPMPDPPVDFG